MRLASAILRICTFCVIAVIARVGAGLLMVSLVSRQNSGDATIAAGEPSAGATPAQQITLLLIVVAVGVLEAMALVHPVSRARRSGVPLMMSIAAVIFGAMALQPFIEAAYFGVMRGRAGLIMLGTGVSIALFVAPAAVLVLRGSRGSTDSDRQETPGVEWSLPRLMCKVGLVAIAYLGLYLVFGYFIAWRAPHVRSYYGGGELEPFAAHVISLLRHEPGLLGLQLARGVIWCVLGWLLVRTMRRGRLESGVAVGVAFAVLMNAQLLLPNAMMPADVRFIHIAETAPSNMLIGLLIGAVFAKHGCTMSVTHLKQRHHRCS